MNSTIAGQVQCAGRFSFVVPATMIITGRGQSLYRTNVTTIPAKSGDIDEYWRRRLAQMGEAPRAVEFLPEVKSAWSARNPSFPEILTLEVVKAVPGALLAIDRKADVGKESIAERLVADIVNSYVPATDRGFCVGTGAIDLEPSQNEVVRLTLQHSGFPEVELRFETQTVTEPDEKTYSDADEERELVSGRGGEAEILRDRPRSAAQLSGKEVWISATIPEEGQFVRFTWHYPGVGASSTQPSINLVGTARASDKLRLEAIWESVLSSLRPIPLGAASR